MAAGVPAACDALLTALEHFGTMSLAEVLEPALALASAGFPVHPGLRGPSDYLPFSIWHNQDKFRRAVAHLSAALYAPGALAGRGEVWRNPDLARTFSLLLEAERTAASQGRTAGLQAARDVFYRGEIAQHIVAFSQRHGGLLELDDLATFTTRIETPASILYRGYEVFKCGPWSQGPVFYSSSACSKATIYAPWDTIRAAYIHHP